MRAGVGVRGAGGGGVGGEAACMGMQAMSNITPSVLIVTES